MRSSCQGHGKVDPSLAAHARQVSPVKISQNHLKSDKRSWIGRRQASEKSRWSSQGAKTLGLGASKVWSCCKSYNEAFQVYIYVYERSIEMAQSIDFGCRQGPSCLTS